MSPAEEIAALRVEIRTLEHSIEVRRAAVEELTGAYAAMPQEERARLQRWKSALRFLRFLLAIELTLLLLSAVMAAMSIARSR